ERHRANARGASSSAACRLRATADGRAVSRTASASPRECAGSVDTTRTRCDEREAATARAAAHVVLPTPPLPLKKMKCGVRVVAGGLLTVACYSLSSSATVASIPVILVP